MYRAPAPTPEKLLDAMERSVCIHTRHAHGSTGTRQPSFGLNSVSAFHAAPQPSPAASASSQLPWITLLLHDPPSAVHLGPLLFAQTLDSALDTWCLSSEVLSLSLSLSHSGQAYNIPTCRAVLHLADFGLARVTGNQASKHTLAGGRWREQRTR